MRVELITPRPQARDHEETSWAAITATGSQLIQACSAEGSGYIGGWTFAGDEEYIKITIMDWRYLRLQPPASITAASATTQAKSSGLVLPSPSSGIAAAAIAAS